jgi:hypothetical protein
MRMTCLVCAVLAIGCGKKQDEQRKPEPERSAMQAQEAKQQAEHAAGEAAEAAAASKKLLEDLENRDIELAERIGAAADALANAQNQADRDSAKAKLDALQQAQASLHAEVAAARTAAARAERLKGVKISRECLDNPLAKGCE